VFLGVDAKVKEQALADKPVLEITKNSDDNFTIKTTSALRNSEITFTLGVEFDETRPDGSVAKVNNPPTFIITNILPLNSFSITPYM